MVGVDDLLELWPELLDEIREGDGEAWNAVRGLQPLSLDADVLTVGVASRTDLDLFKAAGAGPLREAILAATGITVKYLPKPLPEGTRVAARETSTDEEPSPPRDSVDSEPREPGDRRGEFGDPGFDPSGDPDHDAAYDPALTSERDPLDLPEPEPEPEPDPGSESEATSEPEAAASAEDEAEASREPGAGPEPELEREPEAEPEPKAGPESTAEPEPKAKPEREPDRTSLPPVLHRYGEAVVREVLGAKFVEELPLPTEREGEPS